MIATAVDRVHNTRELAATRQRLMMTRADVLGRVQILFLVVLWVVTLVAVVHVAGELANPPTPASQPQPPGFVWGGRTFVDLKSFATWLRAGGHSYENWAQNHRRRAGLPHRTSPASGRADISASPRGPGPYEISVRPRECQMVRQPLSAFPVEAVGQHLVPPREVPGPLAPLPTPSRSWRSCRSLFADHLAKRLRRSVNPRCR